VGGQSTGSTGTVLAGVLKVEWRPSAATGGVSSAGALGQAQFEPPTWAAYGVDGDGDGRKDALDPADAIAGAANYLKFLGAGAPAEQRAALCHYNAGDLPAFRTCMDGTQHPELRRQRHGLGRGATGGRYIGGGSLPAVQTHPRRPAGSSGSPRRSGRPTWRRT